MLIVCGWLGLRAAEREDSRGNNAIIAAAYYNRYSFGGIRAIEVFTADSFYYESFVMITLLLGVWEAALCPRTMLKTCKKCFFRSSISGRRRDRPRVRDCTLQGDSATPPIESYSADSSLLYAQISQIAYYHFSFKHINQPSGYLYKRTRRGSISSFTYTRIFLLPFHSEFSMKWIGVSE